MFLMFAVSYRQLSLFVMFLTRATFHPYENPLRDIYIDRFPAAPFIIFKAKL